MLGKNSKVKLVFFKVIRAIEVAVCVILAIFVIVNVTLIIKSYVSPDVVPDFFGYKPFIVLSGSMEPEILTGDIIVTKKIVPEDILVGDIISFRAEDDTIISHRVTEINTEGGLSFLTKGDANVGTDAGTVSPDKVEGLYIWRIANLGRFALFIQTPIGMLIFVITPICLFILYDFILRSARNRKRSNREKEPAALKTAEKGDDD